MVITSGIPKDWKRRIMRSVRQNDAPLRTVTITKKQYEKFKKEYIVHILKDGSTFGRAFCQHFKIYDMFIDNETNMNAIERYIKHTYINRQQVVRAFVA